jgi:hypothetical protein
MNLYPDTLWFEISLVCGITAFGSIFFGHFEEHTPKYRRALKLVFFNAMVVFLSACFGRTWSLVFLGIVLSAGVYVHAIWLPGKGINGLTGEPKKKYYELRGWTKYLNDTTDKNNGDPT